jgi:hypothetical protein
MIYAPMNPRLQMILTRLARLPRWVWVAFFIGVVVPIVVLGASLLLIALLCGMAVAAAGFVVATIVRGLRRLGRPRTVALDAGRRNVRVVVTSARVIDP